MAHGEACSLLVADGAQNPPVGMEHRGGEVFASVLQPLVGAMLRAMPLGSVLLKGEWLTDCHSFVNQQSASPAVHRLNVPNSGAKVTRHLLNVDGVSFVGSLCELAVLQPRIFAESRESGFLGCGSHLIKSDGGISGEREENCQSIPRRGERGAID